MTDYSLGRAHGKIEIDYDDRGVSKAIVDLDKATGASDELDKSLSKTHKTLDDTARQFEQSGSGADGYARRLRDVRAADEDVARAEQRYRAVLLDTRSTLDDVKGAQDSLTDAKRRQTAATNAERDAHRALSHELNVGQRAVRALTDLLPNLKRHLSDLRTVEEDTTQKSTHLARALSSVAKVLALAGPEAEVFAGDLELGSKAIDKIGSSATSGAHHIRNFIKDMAGFESAFGKISGLSLGIPALGGLGAIGGASMVQGIINIAGAVRQLSGALGLLPATVSGVGVVMGTLKIALHGVGSALKDMMADDPKKFLQDIKNMAPGAAEAMLQIAQFRDQFKLGAATIQESFFAKISADIKPLIHNLLPALVSGASKVAGALGDMADMLAKGLMTPENVKAFSMFIDNITKGLEAMKPAIAPLFNMFSILSQVGSSFFGQIGDQLTKYANFFEGVISKAASSGKLQAWIQDGINAFGHLVNIMYSFGAAFNHIMDIADKFGGGGLLGWIDKLAGQLNAWTQSAAGQKALIDFFTTVRQATDAFLPMLGPLLEGLLSIGTAFVKLGVETAPEWLQFFRTFAMEMAHDLGPAIQGMGPAVATFLSGLTTAFRQLMQTLGPQLPRIFQDLANAFVQLAPQIPQMAVVFVQLAEAVGPQLPGLFKAITDTLRTLLPYVPNIAAAIRDFVYVLGNLIKAADKVIGFIRDFVNAIRKGAKDIPGALSHIGDVITNFFKNLPQRAEDWGKNILSGLVRGLANATGLGALTNAAKNVVNNIAGWFQHSPAKWGPFSGSGYTLVRGQQMVKDMAAGMVSARGAVSAAAASTAAAASHALGATGSGGGGGRAGAPAPGGRGWEGNALLPPNIANADVGILDAYLNHKFDPNRGLKGLAKDLGRWLKITQSGFNLLFQHVVQPMFSALNMIPGIHGRQWRKMSPQAIAEREQQKLLREAASGQQSPTWGDVLGGAAGSTAPQQIPLGLTAGSSKTDIQKAIIAAGKARGLSNADIETALAVAAAESGFNPTISGGIQGSAGLVSGLYQQSPSSGWGTMAQVNDPNHAINAFYNAFVNELAKNPGNPLLAAVLTQNPQLGSNAQGSAYWNAVSAKLGLGSSILKRYGPGISGPSWSQVTGGPPITLPPGAKIGHDGSISVPPGTALPTVPGGGTVMLNPQSRAGTLGGANVTYTPDLLEKAGIGPLFEKTTPNAAGGAGIPQWAKTLAAMFGLTATDHPDTTLHGGTAGKGNEINPMGSYAFDFSGSQANMDRFAQFIMTNLAGQTLQLIHRGAQRDYGIAGGQDVSTGHYYQAWYPGHKDHVHWATDVPPVLLTSDGKAIPVQGTLPAGANSNLRLPSGKMLGQVLPQKGTDPLTGLPYSSVNDRILQNYLSTNPSLRSQISTALQPGASDNQVLNTLNTISTTITGLKTQDAIGNKNTIDALSGVQSSIADQQGFTQGQSTAQSAMQMGQAIAGGVSNSITSVLTAIQGGLDAMSATQDIADRMVYGLRNTEDVLSVVNDFQKYITFAADIANATGSILQMVGSIVSTAGEAGATAAGMGADPGASVAAAGQGIQVAGEISQLIAGALQGINQVITWGEEIYHVVGTYVGRFLSDLLAGPGGTPLMGNVRMLMNENTGQLLTYSQDNPLNKNVFNVPGFFNGLYGWGKYGPTGGGNPNPQINQQWNLYAGPGQSPAQMMNETMWLVGNGGTTGAMAPANF